MNDRRDPHVAELEAEVARLESQVQELSRDAVTGVWGRGVLDRALGTEFARARRFGRHLGVLMIDIDHFKAVNDAHGHRVGDAVLYHVAQTIQSSLRGADTLARYGGEEFCVLVDGATADGLRILGERVRGAVEQLETPGNPGVTISIGAAVARDDEAADALLERADVALYDAKEAGRNRVCLGKGTA